MLWDAWGVISDPEFAMRRRRLLGELEDMGACNCLTRRRPLRTKIGILKSENERHCIVTIMADHMNSSVSNPYGLGPDDQDYDDIPTEDEARIDKIATAMVMDWKDSFPLFDLEGDAAEIYAKTTSWCVEFRSAAIGGHASCPCVTCRFLHRKIKAWRQAVCDSHKDRRGASRPSGGRKHPCK